MPRKHDDTFKRVAVELLLSSGRPLKVLAKEQGVCPAILRGWRNRHFASLSSAWENNGGDPKSIYEENRTLRREKVGKYPLTARKRGM